MNLKQIRKVVIIATALGIPLATPAVHAAQVVKDIAYFSPGSKSNLLDLYLPAGGLTAGTPTVLFIHGGGWSSGDKSYNTVFDTSMADAGYAVVTCNYTLSTTKSPSYPQAIYDAKAAVSWIRTEGKTLYGLSPKIIAIGESVGGHLALMLGSTAGTLMFEPVLPPAGGYRVDAVVSIAGVSGLANEAKVAHAPPVVQFLGVAYTLPVPAIYAAGSPLTYVTAGDPPVALFHGTADTTVPWQQSQKMKDALVTKGVYADLTLATDGAHGFAAFGGEAATSVLVRAKIPALLAHP